MELCDRILNPDLLVRRISMAANHVLDEASIPKSAPEQLDLFTDYAAVEAQQKVEEAERERERKMQQAMLSIQKKFGKNAIVKGMNLEDGATTMERNQQIGGHKA
jgi:DNA polymerase V